MDTSELVERRTKEAEEAALRFDAMAARIRRNGTDSFGGAFLLMPPGGVGAAIELLTLSDQNPGYFWDMVFMTIQEERKRVQDIAARQRGFG